MHPRKRRLLKQKARDARTAAVAPTPVVEKPTEAPKETKKVKKARTVRTKKAVS